MGDFTLIFAVWNSHITNAKERTKKTRTFVSAYDLSLEQKRAAKHYTSRTDWGFAYPLFEDPILHSKNLTAWREAEARGEDVGPIVVRIAKSEGEFRAEIIDYEPDSDDLRSRLYGDLMLLEPDEH